MKSYALASCAFIVTLSATASVTGQTFDRYEERRKKMVREYLERDGITNERVLKAFRTVPRHEFCRPQEKPYAYLDTAMPIGYRQTISPPFVVAYMTETIDPKETDKVLEIGTGSGYQGAILSVLVKKVYTIEIVPQLGKAAAKKFKRLGYTNVEAKVGDGFKGWPEAAPFDKIIVTCSPEKIPKPLVDQLKEGGKMIIPIGRRYQQVFYLLEKKDGKLKQKKLIPTLFVPMTGISEKNRKVKPDPANPKLHNGGFEADDNKDDKPDNWHYQRQVTLHNSGAPEGKRYISIQNAFAGRRAQLLQGMPMDGRKVKKLQLTARVRYRNASSGTKSYERPGIYVHFFDTIRKPIAIGGFRPLRGTQAEWKTLKTIVRVPNRAREAIMQIGLNGGTGRLEIDAVELKPVK